VVSTTAPAPRQVKRFLTGPIGCEITGPLLSPDNKTFFCGLQHIGGENAQAVGYRGQQEAPFSTFPNDTWPRDTIVYVRRKDGGIVGG
ncbi:MAG: dTDP-glucose 4 6-dehydratase, partial [Hyphomonadaceae bacterium]